MPPIDMKRRPLKKPITAVVAPVAHHPIAKAAPIIAPAVKPAPVKGKAVPVKGKAPAKAKVALPRRTKTRAVSQSKITDPNNQPLVPGSQRRYGDVLKEADASKTLEYKDSDRELQTAMADNAQQSANTGNWFNQYRAQLDGAKAAQAQDTAAAQAEVAGRTQASQTAADTQRSQIDTDARASAASRGTTYSGVPSLDSAQAQESRRGIQDAFQNMLTSQGSARQSYLTDRQGVGAAAQIAGQGKVSARRNDLLGKKADLASKKGSYTTKYIADQKDAETKSLMEQKLLFSKDANAANSLAVTAADDAAKAKAARAANNEKKRANNMTDQNRKSEIGISSKKLGITEAHNKAMEDIARKNASGASPASQKANGKALTRIDDIVSKWGEFRTDKVPDPKPGVDYKAEGAPAIPTRPVKPSDLKAQLRQDHYTNPEIHLALMRRANKPLTAADKLLAKNLGITKVPSDWTRKRKPAPKPPQDLRGH